MLLFKDVRVNKAFKITITHSHTESRLFCIVDYESYFFLLVVTFLIITFPNFFAFLCIWTQHFSSSVLPCWFLVSGKPTVWLFNSLLITGDQTKKSREVLAAYLLCRCKHLSMLFCVVFLPKLKNIYSILHIAGYNINFII